MPGPGRGPGRGPRGGGRGGPGGRRSDRGGPRGARPSGAPPARLEAPERGYAPTPWPRVWCSPYGILTENQVVGVKVYGEKLFTHKGRELRAWNPRRSKLAALMLAGAKRLRFAGSERVLYLGAASGTTVSHLSDMLKDGQVVAVEKSARSFRDLIDVARVRGNILPSLTDARDTDALVALVAGPVDVLYQDIAQRDQAEIFLHAAARFLRPGGMGLLMVKARSVSIADDPEHIYEQIERRLVDGGLQVLEQVRLDPWEKDHAALVVMRPSA